MGINICIIQSDLLGISSNQHFTLWDWLFMHCNFPIAASVNCFASGNLTLWSLCVIVCCISISNIVWHSALGLAYYVIQSIFVDLRHNVIIFRRLCDAEVIVIAIVSLSSDAGRQWLTTFAMPTSSAASVSLVVLWPSLLMELKLCNACDFLLTRCSGCVMRQRK